MAHVSGTVDRVVFQNEETGFCVARFVVAAGDAPEGDITTVVGTMPVVRAGETLSLQGDWTTHPMHGRTFRVEHFESAMPDTAEGVLRYLASGAVKGIGPTIARRIVELFGSAAMDIIDTNPELLRQVPGITSKRLKVAIDSWNEQKRLRDLAIFLQRHKISMALAPKIQARYGDQAIAAIEADPYRLAHEVQGIGFRTADALASTLGMSRRSLSRYVAGIRYTLSQAAERGHVFLPRSVVLSEASQLLSASGDELEPALLEFIRRGDGVAEEEKVYLAAFHHSESSAAEFIAEMMRTPSALTLNPRVDAASAISAAAEEHGIQLAERQLEAAQVALQRKVSILTGGPGTGKTSTLRIVISALEALDVSYCLCAPTGRAAKRVAEATHRPASTIHRLLEYQPAINGFGYDRSRPLPHDFVVVDEVSMLDTILCYHLLKAIPPESHLLLVGDADQLPSVGPGNVLRDLLASSAIPTVTLTDLFRQARGSRIVMAAHSVNSGLLPDLANDPDADFFFTPSDREAEVLQIVKKLVSERIPARFGYDPIDDVQVISPMHGGDVGVVTLNRELQELLNPARHDVAQIRRGDRIFRAGDKVMQVKNDYERDVYNGDIGRVEEVSPDDNALSVLFPSPAGPLEIIYESGDLDQLVLAYAVSVHKAQGSEFPCIVMPVVPRHSILLQRNLVYTAITRARSLCCLVGSEATLLRAAESQNREARYTGLRRRLEAFLTPGAQRELVV